MTQTFLHVYPGGMRSCSLQPAHYARAVETWLCIGCATPKPDTGAVDVRIQGVEPSDAPMSFISGVGVAIARKKLIEAMDLQLVHDDLMIGRVFNESGRELTGWCTVRGRQRVIVRGTENVAYRRCEICARHVYFGMGKRYLFPAPVGIHKLFETQYFGILMTTGDASAFRGRKLSVEALAVVEAPPDGLGELVDANCSG